MDIYILREGQQTGPFDEESTHHMLKQGVVLINDMAWSPGMDEWQPLASVLYPAPAMAGVPAPAAPVALRPPPPPPAAEPATARQLVFLKYLSIKHDRELTKDHASILLNDALEHPRYSARVARWNDEKLTLYPELFADEIHERKEARIQHFLDICHTEGAEVFDGVTKTHVQVLLGFLDTKSPRWDTTNEATQGYFFPAVAEKFPQLVRPEWKGRLKYAEAPRVSTDLKRKTGGMAASPARKQSSPLTSLIRGLFLGLCAVGIIGGTLYLQNHPAERDRLIEKSGLAKYLKPASTTAKPADATAAAGSTAASTGTDTVAKAPESVAAPAAPLAEAPAPAAAAKEEPSAAAAPAPAPAAAPTAEAPAMAAAGSMAPAEAPAPATMGATSAAPAAAAAPAGMSLFDPGTPSTPAAAATTPGAPAAPAADPNIPVAKTQATLTKPFEVQLTYGKIKVPVGTHFKIIEQDGTNLKVQFQNQVISVPVAMTDVAEPAQ